MADAKISALTAVGSPAGSDQFAIETAGGVSKKTLLSEIKTFVANALALAAGSATAASWPTLASGTLLTTAEAGATERDANCFYDTTDASNRGVRRVENLIRLNANRTFVSNTTQQAIFDSPANGRLTLETGTYFFECVVAMASMSATVGNAVFSLIGAGTATLAHVLFQTLTSDIAADTASSAGSSWSQSGTSGAANSGTTNAATALYLRVGGTFKVTGAGTIIPSVAQATAAAAVAQAGSWFRCNRIGDTSLTAVGQWA